MLISFFLYECKNVVTSVSLFQNLLKSIKNKKLIQKIKKRNFSSQIKNKRTIIHKNGATRLSLKGFQSLRKVFFLTPQQSFRLRNRSSPLSRMQKVEMEVAHQFLIFADF